MSIKVNLDNYNYANDELEKTTNNYNIAIENIVTVVNNLDYKVLTFVKEDLLDIKTSLLAMSKNIIEVKDKILNTRTKYEQIEKEISQSESSLVSAISEIDATTASAATGGVVGNATQTKSAIAGKLKPINHPPAQKITGGFWSDAWNSVTSFFTGAVDTIGNAFNTVGKVIADTGAQVGNFVTSTASKVAEFFCNAGEFLWDGIKKVGATIGNIVVGIVQGIEEFTEALIDTCAIIATGVASIFTGLWDLGQWINGKITGNENWTSATGTMWDGVMGFVSTTYIKNAFRAFYENTEVGKWLDANAFECFKSTGAGYQITTGIGYVTGAILFTLATFGLGGATLGAGSTATTGALTTTTAAATTATGAITASQTALIAGLAGFGRGTETAWSQGAELGEGLTYGTLSGAWDGVQFYLGSKIGAVGGFGDQIASKFLAPGASKLTTTLASSGVRVGLDAVDGGLEGFVQPLLQTVYADGYYDEAGNYIEFTDQDGVFTRASKLFDNMGGWSNVGIQTAIGGSASIAGEALNATRLLKGTQPNNVDTTTELLDDINKIGNSDKTPSLSSVDDGSTTVGADLSSGGNIPKDVDATTELLDDINKIGNSDKMPSLSSVDDGSTAVGADLSSGGNIPKDVDATTKLVDDINKIGNSDKTPPLSSADDSTLKSNTKETDSTPLPQVKDGKIDFSDIPNGKTMFSIASEFAAENNAKLYYNFDEFINATKGDVQEWQYKLGKITYTDSKTGLRHSYLDVVKGYIQEEEDWLPGAYGVLNTVNRALDGDPATFLNRLLKKDANGNFEMNEDGTYIIDIKHAFGRVESYSFDPSTEQIWLTRDKTKTKGLLAISPMPGTSTVGTLSDLIDRVEGETAALKAAFSLNKQKGNIIVGRGAGWDSLKRFGISASDSAEDIYKKLTANGNIYTDAGFMSSTPEMGGGFMNGANVKFIMEVNDDSAVGNFCLLNDIEKELCLNAGTKFEIKSVRKTSAGNEVYIFLKEKTTKDVKPTSAFSSKYAEAKAVYESTYDLIMQIDDQKANLDLSDPNYATNIANLDELQKEYTELYKYIHDKGKNSDEYKNYMINQDIEKISQFVPEDMLLSLKKISDKVEQTEPHITSFMESLQDDHAKLENLNEVLDTVKTIPNQMCQLIEQGYDPQLSLSKVNNSLYYNFVIDGDYESSVINKLAQLRMNGYEIKNYNNNWNNAIDQKLSVTLADENGTMIEVNFHTPISFETYNILYDLNQMNKRISIDPNIKSKINDIKAIHQKLNYDNPNFNYSQSEINEAIDKEIAELASKNVDQQLAISDIVQDLDATAPLPVIKDFDEGLDATAPLPVIKDFDEGLDATAPLPVIKAVDEDLDATVPLPVINEGSTLIDADANTKATTIDTKMPTVDEMKKSLPHLENATDTVKYAEDIVNNVKSNADELDIAIKKSSLALQTVVENKLSSPYTAYCEMLEFTGADIPSDIKSKIITETINSSPEIRKLISLQSEIEISNSLNNNFGITDPNMVKKVKDCLLGEKFIENGVGSGANWDEYVDEMSDYFTKKLQQEVDSGKEAVIWSGIADENHGTMNAKFATIENATLGSDMYFIDMVYSNWKGEGAPKLKDLWAKLSEKYAQSVSKITSGGENLKQIKFLYPESSSMDTCFGELFKEAELPTICSSGKIEKITMTKVNDVTLDIVDTVDIDIRDVVAYYQANDVGAGLSDTALVEKTFEMFQQKVKEAMV